MEPNFAMLHQVWEMLDGIAHDRAASRHFDLSTYLDNDAHTEGQPYNPLKTPRQLAKHFEENQSTEHCGTVGCAMGFAKLCIPGLRRTLPMGYDTESVSRALGITYSESRELFLHTYYKGGNPTAAEVRDRLGALIERKAREQRA